MVGGVSVNRARQHAKLQRAMKTLGYHPIWLERGIISAEMMLRQYKTNGATYDARTAVACRSSALLAWSIFHVRPTRNELADVIAVLRVDPDREMVKRFLVDLASCASPARMRMLQAAARSMGFDDSDQFDMQFMRKYSSRTLTREDVRRAVTSGDSTTQRCVIVASNRKSVLAELAVKGRDVTVRKAAKTKLREIDRGTGNS